MTGERGHGLLHAAFSNARGRFSNAVAAFTGRTSAIPASINLMSKRRSATDAKEDSEPTVPPLFPAYESVSADAHAADKTQNGDNPEEHLLEDENEIPRSLIFGGHFAARLHNSSVFGKISMVKNTKGSRWWWGRFRKRKPVEVQLGSEKIKAFTSTITDSRMVRIDKLTKKDLEGILPASILARNPIRDLRRAVRRELAKRYRRTERSIPLHTKVKLVKFEPYSKLLEEHEKRLTIPNYNPFAPRKPITVPEDNPLWRMQEFYPKSIVVDLDMFGFGKENPIPPEILADMGKLQRAGVKFAFVSNTPGADHSDKKNQIRSALYGSVFALNGGATVVENKSDRHSLKHRNVLLPFERKALRGHVRRVAFNLSTPDNRIGVKELKNPDYRRHRRRRHVDSYFSGSISPGADPEQFKKALEARLRGHGLNYRVIVQRSADRRKSHTFQIQHVQTHESMPEVLQVFQDMGVYQNPAEVLVLSENQQIIDSIVPAHEELLRRNGLDVDNPHRSRASNPDVVRLTEGKIRGADLADNLLGIILGDYRENEETDFVSSASAMTSYKSYKKRFFEQDLQRFESNVYSHAGHMTHETMNWVAWMHRNGRLPSREEAQDKMQQMWEESQLEEGASRVFLGRRSQEGFITAFRDRIGTIYDHYKSIMEYPGTEFVGTELPNVFMLTKLTREGEKRYFIRTIFDFVAVRHQEDGTVQLLIMDFKSGVQPTRTKLEQDIQPRLYHLFPKIKWGEIPKDYDMIDGELYDVGPRGDSAEAIKVRFIYHPDFITARFDNNTQRIMSSDAMRFMDAMQKEKNRMHIRKTGRRSKKAAKKKTTRKRKKKKEREIPEPVWIGDQERVPGIRRM